MKKFTLFLLLVLIFSYRSYSQDIDTTSNWDNKGIVSFNLSQVSFTDWTQGGDNAITYTILGDFNFNYKASKWSFTNALKIAYGQTKIAEEDFKTNDNELYFESVYTKDMDFWLDPYISNILRTTITDGFKYDGENKTRIASFFDPGYLSQSIGLGLNKSEIIKTRLGIGFQEAFSSNFTQFTDDPETEEIESFKFETGIESVTDFNWGFMENMLYKSKLRLFTRFEHLDVWDVRWDNTIAAQVNKYIVVNLNVLVVYEKSQSVRTQIKQALQLGITYSLF